MGRNMDDRYMSQIIQRYNELKTRGIPDIEIQRVIMSEFAYGSHFSDPWPPRIEGIDIVDRIYPNLIPAEAYPPRINMPESVAIPGSLSGVSVGAKDKTSQQWLGMAANTIGGPQMHGEEPATNSRNMPEESWFPWKVNEAEPRYAKFVYNNNERCDICRGYDGMIFDLNNFNRPILPSEHLLYTNTHPNCQCVYSLIDPILSGDIKPSIMPAGRQEHLSHVNRIIGQKARYGSLHVLNSDGSLSDATVKFNPRHLQESVSELKGEFKWLSPDYLNKVRTLDTKGGRFMLIRAAAETATDHRSEGEPHKRLLTGMELYAMARTATGKGMDINHNPEWKTNAVVMDSEGDMERKEIQMLVYETDPEILAGVQRGDITAVSINAGAPRTMDTDCNTGECYVVPKGLILGELDGIALTYVVTNPRGFAWRGRRIPPATPGVKTTKIELL